MPFTLKTLLVVATLSTLIATTLPAQSQPDQPDPMTASIQDAARHVRDVFTKAAEQMSEEDYGFRPTPEVRSFGQILAHVAETNYWFCATAIGEASPENDIENARTNDASAKVMKDFMGRPRPALAVLNFRTYHSLLHWGNVITYMRLRGKVPPST